MGLDEVIFGLSNVNCILGSAISRKQQIDAGVPTPIANYNLFGNIANGIARNEFAYGMQKYWHNPAGNIINSFYGYGSAPANMMASCALMNVCSPWLMFNSGIFRYPTMGYYSPMCCYC